ncbi:AI-2E family transporter [Luteolibacter marinus]|uniref:AI-2E family transporter n=1 Tax=Luteolibacter marinus TaxID=2776705 RepID=UPI00186638E2|nr:AI-2E family transporter [Luteolibacter marinus]
MPRPPHPSSLRFAQRNRSAASTLTAIWAVVLSSALLAGFYFGRDVLIPLALASLITFLLAPLVSRLSRWIGNIAAVGVAMSLVLGSAIGLGWSLGSQTIDFAEQLPSYKENIRAKLRSLQSPGKGTLDKISETVEDLEKELPGRDPEEPASRKQREPIRVTDDSGSIWERLRDMASPVLGPLGTASLVFLLSAFMLLKREDLRGRLIRLVGQGRISATTKALDDAGKRVRRYLLMQLVVNVTYGIPLAIGLYFIGIPNAVLWGALAAVLRFIPYIGPWIAAMFPCVLSLAVSPSWVMPLQVVGLFIVLELVSNNVLEPWLYGASTGVSSIALIVSAVFWTWMWGPVGLVLSTPFTVCLVVMGRHIPQLSFLSVVLGEEEALTPAEDCYHRLLREGEDDEVEFAEDFLENRPLVEFYDSVLIPVTIAAEEDHATAAIDREQLKSTLDAIDELVADLGERNVAAEPGETAGFRLQFLASRATRDDLAGAMASQIVRSHGMTADHASAGKGAGEMIALLERDLPDLVCISVVAPSRPVHARNLLQRIHKVLPGQQVVVGLWGRDDEELEDDIAGLREAGALAVFTRIGELAAYANRVAAGPDGQLGPAPRPEDEELRLQTLEGLELANDEPEPVLDHMTAKLSRVFGARIAAITLLDREFLWFKAAVGLPEGLAEHGRMARDLSACNHVVAANETLVVRDLGRDRRFQGLPLLETHGIRFYAGTPVRAANGQALGVLCIMGTSPRGFTPQEKRMLEATALEIGEEIQRISAAVA